MNSKQAEQLNILKYWRAFESCVMPTIEHKGLPIGVERKPQILSSDTELPWPLPHHIVKSEKKESLFVFNVYVGLLEQALINEKIQQILHDNEVDYDLQSTSSLTCLFGFTLDADGFLLGESHTVPDYLVNLYALENFDEKTDWEKAHESAKKQFQMLGTAFSSEQIDVVTFDSIAAHLYKILGLFKSINSENIKFTAVVHIKKIKAPYDLEDIEVNETIDPDDLKGENSHTDKDELIEEHVSTLDIFPSFYLDDLSRVIDSIKQQSCAKGLADYLSEKPRQECKDVYRDRKEARVLLGPNKLPAASWPNPNGNRLSYAQQLAVNVAVGESDGLFSVNGPPGTGKTTLLRDVVSDVVVKRAKVLVGFEKPLDAFCDTIASNVGFTLKTTRLVEELYGHELVVAASNNNAAENVSKELPKIKDINADEFNQFDENSYFSQVADHYFSAGKGGESGKYWGMISAVLGRKENIREFFNHFWSKSDRNSMRYLLERWTFHDEEFEVLVKNKVYKEDQKHYWISDSYKEVERKMLSNWKKERKKFNKLLEQFDCIQNEYIRLQSLFDELKLIESRSENLSKAIEENEKNNAMYSASKSKCYEELQRSEAEVKNLEAELDEAKAVLFLHRSYCKNEVEFHNAKTNKQALIEQLHLTRKSIEKIALDQKLLSQEIKDIEHDKQDYMKIRPGIVTQLLFSKSKTVRCWNTHFQVLVEKGIEKRDKQRKLNRMLLEYTAQLEAQEYECEKQNKLLVEAENAFKKSAKLLTSPHGVANLDQVKETVSLLKNSVIKKKMHNDQVINLYRDISTMCNDAHKQHEHLLSELPKLSDKKFNVKAEIGRIQDKYFHDGDTNCPDSKYWASSDSDLQITSPWINDKLQTVRCQLFWSAMRLHKYFIILARRPLSSNITALKRLLVNNDLPFSHLSNIRSLWASLFLMVPVVSTTFASIGRLFRDLKQEEIGWLMIDEAGQAPPHYAVGAIWRSKRTVVVGDPLQVEPIVTLPKVLSRKLYEYYKVEPIYDVVLQSVQTMSDISNPIGTFIGEDEDKTWVGAPLIVHRRCVDPMFSVSNKIAYNGLMIQATIPRASVIENFFSQSLWISPKNAFAKDSDSHWVEEEGRIACCILSILIKQLGKYPPIYIITPFKSVKSDLIKYIKRHYLDSWKQLVSDNEAKSLHEKLYEMIGTIHTFQGKQADAVILLLGGNIRKRGAISWASAKPNMLNVAITRAKKLLYVIGNINVWGQQPYFSELAESMQVVFDGKGFKEKTFVLPESDKISIQA